MNEEKASKKRSKYEDEASKPSLVAKKDFHLWHPHETGEYRKVIKAGDDLSDVPELYHPNLKSEGVL